MATLAIAAIAASLVPPAYAAIAFSVAASVASYLLAPKLPTIEGPRLNDLKSQSSTYGEMLPIVFGTARLSGKMIWSKPIRETRHTETVGGKGGGGQEVHSYTYSQTFAIAICEGPISVIRRIWANGELIYNVADDATAETIIASFKRTGGLAGFLAGPVVAVVGNSDMVIYLGTETQTPDATIQADVGVANCPAYRGTAYIVFNNLQLSKYGNRAPNLEFEVITATLNSPLTSVTSSVSHVIDAAGGTVSLNLTGNGHSMFSNGIRAGGIHEMHVPSMSSGGAVTVTTAREVIGVRMLPDVTRTIQLDLPSGAASGAYPPGYCMSDGRTFPLEVYTGVYTYWHIDLDLSEARLINGLPTGPNALLGAVKYGDHLYLKTRNSGVYYFYYVDLSSSVLTATLLFSSVNRYAIFTADNDGWYICDSTSTRSYTHGTITLLSTVAQVCSDPTGFARVADGWLLEDRPNLYKIGDDGTKVKVLTVSSQYYSGYVYGSYRDGIWYSPETTDYATYTGNYYGIIGAVSGSTTLSLIVTSICARVGVVAGDIDVSTMTDEVDGYVVTRRMTARAAIEPLMGAFYFDGVESDAKIKFVKRGGTSAVSIEEDDLACHNPGSEMPDPVRITRGQEMDLPREITVSYIDSGSAYQTGTQYSRRLITSSQNKADLQFAIAMSAAKAKQISDVALFTAWAERNSAPLVTDRSYAFYEPTDIITVTQGNVAWIMRLTQKNERDGMIEWHAVAEEQAVYTQAAAAAALPAPILTVDMAGPTQLTMLDIPLLRDQDDGYGFYLAVSGYLSGWPGAQGYKSNDNEQSWQLAGDGFFAAATQGYAATALGNFTGGNIFDESSTVSVVVNAALAGTTELAVLNGANAILIGDEVLQFKNATLTATNTYTLTGLLRGRRGTEWAMSTHAIGDRVVLLTSTTVYRMPNASAELNLARDWRAVSFGTYLDEAETITFTDTGVGLECYSPVQIGGGRDASNNLTINWKRRTRIGGEWRDYVDATLGESVEAYEIDIYSGANVVRTITAATNTASYSAANQTTDGLTPGNPVVLKIYQLSSSVGRGYPGSATV